MFCEQQTYHESEDKEYCHGVVGELVRDCQGVLSGKVGVPQRGARIVHAGLVKYIVQLIRVDVPPIDQHPGSRVLLRVVLRVVLYESYYMSRTTSRTTRRTTCRTTSLSTSRTTSRTTTSDANLSQIFR